MPTPILATKLYSPPTRPEFVPRPRLIERLNQAPRSGRKLTLISAPAGFGKTTLVSSWIRRLEENQSLISNLQSPKFAWLSLLAAFFRLGQAAILGLNLLNLFFMLQLLSGADYLTAFSTDQLHALALFFFNGHAIGYSLAMVPFALSCLCWVI